MLFALLGWVIVMAIGLGLFSIAAVAMWCDHTYNKCYDRSVVFVLLIGLLILLVSSFNFPI